MGIKYNTSIVRNGLVLHLDAANKKSYPGSGTVWTDLSGNNNHSTLTNGPTFNSANNGYFILDGGNDYIETNYIMPLTDFTISCVFKRTGASYWAGMWASEIWNNGTGYLAYFGSATALSFSKGGGSSSVTVNPSTYCTITNFNQYVFTRESSGSSKIYINGLLVSSGSITASSVIPKTIILGGRHSNDGTISGADLGGGCQIAAFNVYNRAITAAEVKQNFEALRGRYGI